YRVYHRMRPDQTFLLLSERHKDQGLGKRDRLQRLIDMRNRNYAGPVVNLPTSSPRLVVMRSYHNPFIRGAALNHDQILHALERRNRHLGRARTHLLKEGL